jgi:DNA polymerase-3 subunit beta
LQVSPNELLLRATDLEISFQASFDIESALTEGFQFLVHAKRLMELIKDLDGQLCFVWNGSSVQISSEHNADTAITLSTATTENFPQFPERIENLIDLDANFLLDAITKVDPFIPVANANTALNGLLIQFDAQGLSFVATDGHSLALFKSTQYSLSDYHEWIIPKKAVSELKKTLDLAAPERVFVGICAGQLVFSGGNFNLFTRQIADKFPDYKPILQREQFLPGQVDKSLLTAALRRASCLLAGKFVSAKFKFEPQFLEINLANKEIGSLNERIPLSNFTGQGISCNFYPPYVLTALQQIDSDKANFMIKSGVTPLFLDSVQEHAQTTYLIMPVVNNDFDAA